MAHFKKLLSVMLTMVFLLLALWSARQIWLYYMESPWTRDGRIRADVVNMSTDVPGLIDRIMVKNNDTVKKGDVLFIVDQRRYQLAFEQAKANLERLKQQSTEAENINARRQRLNNFASQEDKDHAYYALNAAVAEVQQAEVELDIARLNLQRATVRSPVDGYVTNLLLRPGEYANEGDETVTLVDANSFYVVGYFEETKLAHIRIGDTARIKLLASSKPIFGHVDSIARGIVDNSLNYQTPGLMAVNPSFDWVRLSQRIPVYIHLDNVPDSVTLTAGLTATIYLGEYASQNATLPKWRKDLKSWWEDMISL